MGRSAGGWGGPDPGPWTPRPPPPLDTDVSMWLILPNSFYSL